jgi:hypothetical protein
MGVGLYSFKDNNFTVIGLTVTNGDPTMCAIITTTSRLKVTYVTGFNHLSDGAQDVCGKKMKALQEDIDAMKDDHSNGADHMFTFGQNAPSMVLQCPRL